MLVEKVTTSCHSRDYYLYIARMFVPSLLKKDLLDNNADCKELLAVFGFTNRNDTDEYAVVWKP